MRRVAKWLAWILAVLIGLPVLLVVIVLVGANLGPGRALLVRLVPSLTGGQVAIAGLGGRFPDALRAATVELRDTKGAYLTLHDVVLDWSPLRLAGRVLDIDQLTAADGVLARQPESSSSSSSSSGLPVKLVVHHLHLGRLELAPAAVGVSAALALDGSGTLDSYTTGQGKLSVTRLDSPGSYDLDANVDHARVHLAVQVNEPPHGLIAAVASLPDLGAIAVNAVLDGPREAVATRLAVTAGQLQANAQGSLDLVRNAADLTIAAHAPSMTPRPDVSWQAIALDARVQGPFARPNLNGRLQLDQVSAAGAGVQRLVADVAGDQGLVRVHATADGVVTSAGRMAGYGKMIHLSHGYGLGTRYGHLSEILVRPGQRVHRGDVIGLVGSTGRSSGPHLHYEVFKGPRQVPPLPYLREPRLPA
jgi:translocation and assembly module TamB